MSEEPQASMLSDDERRKIYEEEKARLEARRSLEKQRAPAKKKSCIPLVGVFIVISLIGACVGGSGGSSGPTTSTGLSDGPGGGGVGVDARLHTDGSPLVLARTKDDMDALVKAAVAKDDVGFNQILAENNAYVVPDNTKVHTIDRSFTMYKVRISEGAHRGEEGWFPPNT